MVRKTLWWGLGEWAGSDVWVVMCGLQWGFIAREGHQAQLEYNKDK